jgi:fused signal recognition particle receptor
MGFFSKTLDKLKGALRKTAVVLNTDVRTLFIPGRQIDEAALNEWEEKLLQADMGVKPVQRMIGEIRDSWRLGKIKNGAQAEKIVRDQILAILTRVPPADRELKMAASGPTVILVAGINGAGKTTSIAKLAWILKNQSHKKVMVCASDTFRAAAVDQLQIWGERTGAAVVTAPANTDAASLAHDALSRAQRDGADILLIDTAGRLHNKTALMEELRKIIRVLRKLDPSAPHATLLTLDATIGQNAIAQVGTFKEMVELTGLIVTKLDGSARGGIVVALADRFGLPIHAVGTGEQAADLRAFDATEFARALVGL